LGGEEVTEGARATVLHAEHGIDSDPYTGTGRSEFKDARPRR
jgi:hypothetical protein